MKNITSLRANYGDQKLEIVDLKGDPISFFKVWLNQAIEKKIVQANAMTLSTYSKDKGVSSRIVLLKEVIGRKFIFYTNYLSTKGLNIEEDNRVSLNFFWVDQFRQVNISGVARKLSAEKSDEYFKSRPLESQSASIASKQSGKLDSREGFIREFKKILSQKVLERPDHWGGYEIEATSIEFWQGRKNRMHDRVVCDFIEQDRWNIFRKYP